MLAKENILKSTDLCFWTRIRFLFVVCLVILIQPQILKCTNTDMASEQENDNLFAEKNFIFSVNLINVINKLKPNENIVVSPLSVQTCAAMARIGASGQTAAELERSLNLISTDVNEIGESFYQILKKYHDSDILKIANKVYVMSGYTIKGSYNEILSKNFFTTADEINFAESVTASTTINDWVKSKTNNLINNLVSPNAFNSDTRLVLLNAIHFKGEWVHKFRKSNTHEHDFYLNEHDTVKVEMMSQKERFAYAELAELDATALELPYKNTDLTMLIVLPNSRTGLKSVMEKLQQTSLTQIAQKLSRTQVLVKIPKFKAEFEIELNEPFKQLGMTRMFSQEAEFDEMVESLEPLKVSKVIHKAFIDVNEEGTEAAAATAMLIRKKRSMGDFTEDKEFFAEHPFLYFIKQTELLPKAESFDSLQSHQPLALPLFMGSVTKLINVHMPSTVDITLHDEF